MPDSDQLAVWYQDYHLAVFGVAYAVLKNRAEAEDITHTVFSKLLHNDDAENPIRNPRAWLITVARNLACNTLRDRKREMYDDGEHEAVSEPSSDGFEEELVFSLDIRRALTVLSDLEQELFILHYVDGYKHRELSEIYALPIGTVKTHCHSAKKKLKRALSVMEQEDSV